MAQRLSITGGLATLAIVVSVAAGLIAPALAEPTPAEPQSSPYPELRYFSELDAAPYAIPQQGFWFVTAQGLNCGIWFRGSFGCDGAVPGAPPNIRQIGWVSGDARVHYDWTMSIRFPQSRGSLTIPPLSYITSESTTCATTVDGSTYCEHGPFRMLITPTHTWLNG